MDHEIKTIDREELKSKLDRGDDFSLYMALHQWAFDEMHIPGSELLDPRTIDVDSMDKNAEIIVYCSDKDCIGSQVAYRKLTEAGFTNVRRYEGGLSEWLDSGLPLEGDRFN